MLWKTSSKAVVGLYPVAGGKKITANERLLVRRSMRANNWPHNSGDGLAEAICPVHGFLARALAGFSDTYCWACKQWYPSRLPKSCASGATSSATGKENSARNPDSQRRVLSNPQIQPFSGGTGTHKRGYKRLSKSDDTLIAPDVYTL